MSSSNLNNDKLKAKKKHVGVQSHRVLEQGRSFASVNVNANSARSSNILSNREVPQHISAAIPRKNRSLPKYDHDNSFSTEQSLVVSKHKKQSIPGKKRLFKMDEKLPRRQSSSSAQRWGKAENQNPILRISQTPFIVGIKYRHLPSEIVASLQHVPSPPLRTSSRNLKRKLYAESNESDSDFLKDSDDDDTHNFERPKKRLQKASKNKNFSRKNPAPSVMQEREGKNPQPIINGEDITAPPNGTLASLWYSQEIYSHIWVIDKIIGWKKRKKVSIVYNDESVVKLSNSNNISGEISDKLINYYMPKSSKRMDLSRINPSRCPLVTKAYVEQQCRKFASKKSSNSETNVDDKLKATDEPMQIQYTGSDDMEEVLLIKWRGKSYLHCSWERSSDLELFDTTNNTAKGKIKRFYQSQHMALGKDWKKVLESRISLKSGDPAKEHLSCDSNNKWKNHLHLDYVEEEVYFSPDCIEVERILACDENEMDMKVMSAQRELNLIAEKERDSQHARKVIGASFTTDYISALDEETQWDPEDNVRYVVKWKSLQLTEITWEYWMHIKHKCVDEVEDYWHRQKLSNANDLSRVNTNPTMREYKKLTESPVFGISKRRRPVGIDGITDPNITDVAKPTTGLQLRTYQLEGVNWLIWNWWNKRSCILADEMGLGKTIQSLCFLDQLYRLPTTNVPGPFLIVAPLSLVNQWQAECKTWAPDFNVILYHGSSNARDYLFQQEFYFAEPFVTQTVAMKLKRQHMTKFNILITTYEVIMKDLAIFTKIKWKALIVDEAHRLKNNESRLFSDLGSIPREFCLLLTGTPLQNTTEELWSLLNFSEPKTFSSKEDFVSKFGQLSDSKQVSQLHSVLRPYLLRRVKEDVEKSLPPKEETILEVSLTPIQKTYYKAIYEKNTSFLMKGSKSNNAPSLMNVMMELRKCCNHPFLIKGAEERIMGESSSISEKEKETISDPLLHWQKVYSDKLVQSSGKMVILMKLLPKLQSGGHKVLIFSQMVKMLELLEELLRSNNFNYERLDGSTSPSSRQTAVDRFNQKSYNKFVMLLSTRAGGLGLNLTTADTVIIFDSDWNPQNDLQAMARAHRIGQTRAVKVYRLLTAKTYEMHMFHSASMKLGLDRAVLAHQRQNDQVNEVKTESDKQSHAKEIDQLLKKGAYDVFRDDDDTEAKQFMETDIDQLLQRSSTVTYGKTTQSCSSSLGSFSKASFVTSDVDGKDIDLDDPDFWSKAVGLEVSNAMDKNILINEKRSRKQVQVFDPYASFAEEEQKKKEKIAHKALLEKEEKKRLKEEQRLKREEEKERKKRQREEIKAAKEKLKAEKVCEKPVAKKQVSSHTPVQQKVKSKTVERRNEEEKKLRREIINKKVRREEQKRLKRDLIKEDPIRERVKQAWDLGHRDKLLCLLLEFGFGRLCKIRNEAILQTLPLHDLEIFLRAAIFQLGIQAHHALVHECINYDSMLSHSERDFDSDDGQWVLNAIISSGTFCQISKLRRTDVRMPQTLVEPEFLELLQSGTAISSLYSLAFLSRFNNIFDEALNEIFAGFGREELGKRGCFCGEVSCLDIDLRVRHVTTEELSHAIGKRVDEIAEVCSSYKPTSWWDRSCDMSILLGTFYHGLGNYSAIFNDKNLPFESKMNSLEDVTLCNVYAKENINRISKSISSFFESSLFSLDQKDKIVKKDIKINNNDGIVTTDNIKILVDEGKSKDGSNVTNPLKAFSLDLLVERIYKDLSAAYEPKMNNMTSIKPPALSTTLLNTRLEQLVSLIENSQSRTFTQSCRRDYQSASNLQRAKDISPLLCSFLKDLGHEKIQFHVSFCNHFKPVSRDINTHLWININVPKIKRGCGLPKMISWNGVVGLVNSGKGLVQQLIDRITAVKEKNETIHTSSFTRESMFKAKVPPTISSNQEFRQSLCASILCCGIPSVHEEKAFHYNHVVNIALQLLGSGSNHESISKEDVKLYFTDVLLPYCLQLSLHHEDSKDDTDKHHSKNGNVKSEKCFLPDPMKSICEHSEQSCELASIILRRVKLCRAIQHIISDDSITRNVLFPILQNKKLLPKNVESNIPIWWVPRIHDFALLEYAAKNGLLIIALDYKDQSHRLHGTAFERSRLEMHVRGVFFDEDKSLVPKFVQDRIRNEEVDSLITGQLNEFPSVATIEERLDFIIGCVCNCIKSNGGNEEWIYFSLPMFDCNQFPQE